MRAATKRAVTQGLVLVDESRAAGYSAERMHQMSIANVAYVALNSSDPEEREMANRAFVFMQDIARKAGWDSIRRCL